MSTKGRPGPIVPFIAGADLARQRIVGHGTADDTVTYPTDSTEANFGVTDRPAKRGQPVDVCVYGVVAVEYGANVTRGDLLASDAAGKAVAISTTGHRVIGVALATGADGDIGRMIITQGIV